MCLNYKEKICIAVNKKCILGEKGESANRGECKLHGNAYIYLAKNGDVVLTEKEIVKETGEIKESNSESIKNVLAYYIDFLIADEIASKKAARLGKEVVYDF